MNKSKLRSNYKMITILMARTATTLMKRKSLMSSKYRSAKN
jgi:hypothetical protein